MDKRVHNDDEDPKFPELSDKEQRIVFIVLIGFLSIGAIVLAIIDALTDWSIPWR